VTFSGEAGFDGATFSGDALFHGVTFAGNAEFGGATFASDAVFDRATVSDYLGFGGTTFTRTARFTEAVVHGELAMVAIARRVIAIGMRGRGRLELRLRAAEVDLGFAVLAGPVSVHALQQPIAGIAEAAFADEAGRVPPVRVISLRLLDASSVTLTDVDLSRCRFAGLHRVDQLVLDGRCEFANGPHGRRWVLAEEQHWRVSRAAPPPLYEDPGQEHPEVVGPARLEVLYRQLRKALEDAKNEPGAADFYYGEMEMRRAASRGGDRVLLWLYWLTSGYGLRAGRALMALAVVVATLAVAMQYAGFPGKPVGYLDALLYSLRSAVSVEVKTPALPEQVTRWGQLVRILLRVTGPLFVGLAILAVRNRVKR
jgi:Pentapeptide repeats (9 copies)